MGDNVNISKKYDGSLWTGFIWLMKVAASLNGANFFSLSRCEAM